MRFFPLKEKPKRPSPLMSESSINEIIFETISFVITFNSSGGFSDHSIVKYFIPILSKVYGNCIPVAFIM